MNGIREFIELLEQNNEIIRVKEFVSINGEMAEINDRIIKSGGKALLFENNESDFPVLVNMFGSERRIALALRVDSLEGLTHRIDDMFKVATAPKRTFSEKLKMLPLLKSAAQWMPKNRKGRGRCQDVIMQGEQIDLQLLPILKSAPYDAAAFVTLPLVNTIDPESGQRNVGMYRMQILSNNSTAMHWHKHKTGERHYQQYKQRGEMMPIAVCIGGDPAYTYCATAPLPDGIDEYILSGFIRNKSVKLVKCITNNLRVPEDCDFVIEGYIDPSAEKVLEGPFGDHTGFYSLEDFYPILNVSCITYRRDAVYAATVVGIPPQEDAFIGMATEKIFLAPIKAIMQPDVQDMFLPIEGVAHNIAIIDIEKNYTGQALKVANGMWGAGQMMFNKFIIVTSSLEGKLRNYENYREPLRDMIISEAVITSRGPLDVLDHNSLVCGYGGKMCFDLTHRVQYENQKSGVEVYVPEQFVLPCGIEHISGLLAQKGWSVLLLAADRKQIDMPGLVDELIKENKIKGVNIFIFFDKEHDLEDIATLVWVAGNNIDPVRDAIITKEYIVFDARSKFAGMDGFIRPWPNVVVQSEEVVRAIDEKWERLALGEFIESPSLKYRKLNFTASAKVEI